MAGGAEVSTALAPELSRTSTDRPREAHIVREEGLTEAYVMGTEVEALCGYRWVPSRDPEGLPICEACLAAAGSARPQH